ncbi:MAG: HAD hydrolase-like protein, partial [Peptococcaceae bacterium]|nr:HAD hydrolase-like protein [Peptococcaceae bacterium]
RTVCLNGDGGFQINIQDLATISRLGLPIKFFVINNQGYGSIRNTQRNYFDGRYIGSSDDSGVYLPDMRELGRAYGFDVFQVRTNADISDVAPLVLGAVKPAICEVLVDPDDTLQFRSSSALRPDGSSVSVPIEDLFPRLPREEFYRNMIVKPTNATGVNICNIMFDLDGTIADSSEGIIASVKYALGKLGYTTVSDAAICGSIGLSLMDMLKKVVPGLEQYEYEQLAGAYREYYADRGVSQCRLYIGIDSLLEALSGEFDLYVVTSKPTEFANVVLRQFGIGGYFQAVLGVELGFTPQRKSILISELISYRGLDRAKTLMIGDRAEDIIAAKENGINTVAVSYGFGNREELASALITVDTVEELKSVLY